MELEYRYNCNAWAIIWDSNKGIDIGEWSICGGDRLERFYYSSISHVLISEFVHTPDVIDNCNQLVTLVTLISP